MKIGCLDFNDLLIWRLYFYHGCIYFYGSEHTYTLLPHYEKNDRENW